MPRPYPPEFRARAVVLVCAGKQAKQTAVELGTHPVTLSNWVRQDDIDNGRRPGVPTSASAELRPAKRRIRELVAELLIVWQAAMFLDEERPAQEDLPGDRSSCRRRDPHRPLLPGAGSGAAAPLPTQAQAHDSV